MVLRICKWYQTVRLVMTPRLVPSVTFLGQFFKLTYLGHYVLLFVMTSGDLNIDLTQKSVFFTKFVGLSTNYRSLFSVCRYDSCFSRSDRGPKMSPPPPDSEPFRARPE